MKTYDITILGSGPAGYVGALRAAQKGASVALIEKENLGGVCLNEGCIPTKALLDVCHSVHRVNSLSGRGISGSVKVDLAAAVAGKNAMVKKLCSGIEQLLKANGVDIIRGTGSVGAAGEVLVEGSEPVGYKNLIIASGSSTMELGSLPFDGNNIISSTRALNLEEVPESIIIVGGGYIGCEFADFFLGIGTKVTVVEMLSEILPGMDRDLAKPVITELERAGAELLTGTKLESARESSGRITAEMSPGGSREAARILVAVGRTPNTDIGDLAALGVTVGRGGIEVDEHCAASAANIYAAGDVTGRLMLAHAASKQAEVAVDNALGGESEIIYSLIPECIFASPEVSSVGLSESAAKEEGIKVKVAKFPYAALGRAISTGDTNGFAKIIGGEDGDVVGMQVVGRGASEIIVLGGLAIQIGATVEDLADMIVMHPTFSEAVREAADVWLGKPLHTK